MSQRPRFAVERRRYPDTAVTNSSPRLTARRVRRHLAIHPRPADRAGGISPVATTTVSADLPPTSIADAERVAHPQRKPTSERPSRPHRESEDQGQARRSAVFVRHRPVSSRKPVHTGGGFPGRARPAPRRARIQTIHTSGEATPTADCSGRSRSIRAQSRPDPRPRADRHRTGRGSARRGRDLCIGR